MDTQPPRPNKKATSRAQTETPPTPPHTLDKAREPNKRKFPPVPKRALPVLPENAPKPPSLMRFSLASLLIFIFFAGSFAALIVKKEPWVLEATYRGYVAGRPDQVFTADGKFLATASWDGAAHLIDLEERKEVKTFYGHSARLSLAEVSADGKVFNTASDSEGDGTLLTVQRFKGDNSCLTWDVESEAIMRIRDNFDVEFPVSVSRNGMIYTMGNTFACRPFINDMSTYVNARWPVQAVSPDGRFLVRVKPQLHIFDTAKLDSENECKEVLFGPVTGYFTHDFTPDGRLLAVASKNGSIYLVNLANDPSAYFSLQGFANCKIEAMTLAPDGERILVKSSLGGPRVLDIRSAKTLANAAWGDRLSGTNHFSPDGERIVSTEGARLTHIWDSHTGELLTSLEASPVENTAFEDTAAPSFGGDRLPYGVFAAFSPDGRRLVTGGNAVRVYYRAFPEGWTGNLYRPELWLALIFGGWSIKRMSTRLPEVWQRLVNWWEWQGIKVKKRKKKAAVS